MNSINDILNISNSNDAWDNLDQRSKLNILRQALHEGIVDVSAIKRLYNNKVQEDYERNISQQQQQQQQIPQLSTNQLQEIYNAVEGNPQQYCGGGFINRYDEGTSDLQTQADTQQVRIPLYIMPMPVPIQQQEQQQQDIDYDRLQDWIVENFGHYNNITSQDDYLTLPQRHSQVIRGQVKPSITTSNVFNNLAIQEDFDDIRQDRNIYKGGGRVKKMTPTELALSATQDDDLLYRASKNSTVAKSDATSSSSNNASLKRQKEKSHTEFKAKAKKIEKQKKRTRKWAERHFFPQLFNVKPYEDSLSQYNIDQDIYEQNKEIEQLAHDVNLTSEKLNYYTNKELLQERKDRIKELQPLLDQMFPDKDTQSQIIKAFTDYEIEARTKEAGNWKNIPQMSTLYRFLNIWDQSNRPILYDPRQSKTWENLDSMGAFPGGLYYHSDKPKNREDNVLRAMTIPYDNSYILPKVASLFDLPKKSEVGNGPNGKQRNVILLDSNVLKKDGAQEYIDHAISEMAHAYINSHEQLSPIGMGGGSYLKSLIGNNSKAYKTEGEFEHNTHKVIEPQLTNYIYFKDPVYAKMSPKEFTNQAYGPLRFNYVFNNPETQKAIKASNYSNSGSLEKDVLMDYLINPIARAVQNVEKGLGNGIGFIGPGKHFDKGGSTKKTSKKSIPTWQYRGKKDLVIPVDMSPYEALRLVGVPFNPNTQSGYIRPQNASYGVKNSFHKRPWKGSKKYGSAVDLTPALGYTYDDILRALAHPALQKWAKANGYGILDERPASVRARTNATGPHLHFGPDRGATKIYSNPLISPHYAYWESIGMGNNLNKRKDLASKMLSPLQYYMGLRDQTDIPQYTQYPQLQQVSQKSNIAKKSKQKIKQSAYNNDLSSLSNLDSYYPENWYSNYQQQEVNPNYQFVYTPIMLPYSYGIFGDYSYNQQPYQQYLNYDYLMPYVYNMMSYLPFSNYFGNV